MLKGLLSTVALGALIIGGVATPAWAGQVYGDYGPERDLDAPYQGGGEGGRHYDEQFEGRRDYQRPSYGAYRECQERKAVGTGLGAIIGGVIGNQFGHGGGRAAATVGGVILGGIAGHEIARDSCHDIYADEYYYSRAYYDGFESPRYGSAYRWRNPHNGHYGTMTPVRYADGDRYGYDECREFKQTVYIDGRRTNAYGVACRAPDGSWQIVNDD